MSVQMVNSEKRQFNRIAFDAPVILQNDGVKWKSKLVDISLKGALIQKPDNWTHDVNDCFRLSIQLDSNTAEINMDVKLTHTEDEQLGFNCVHIDIDSITMLKRLVELNLGNEQLLDREITNMLGQ